MRKNVELAGYKAPTPIQRYTFPAIRDGLDVVAVAQTGLSFPFLNQFWAHLMSILRLR